LSFTVDSNVLVYAVDSGADHKHDRAIEILIAGRDSGLLLTAQAIAEFLNVIRRKYPRFLDQAREEAARWALIYPVLPTSISLVLAAERLAAAHRLQLWDSLIWQIARAGGASFLISEDMHDGLSVEGMTVINPFNPDNDAPLNALLSNQ
jgi:predicted nucleic acid-binding protein